LEQTELDEIKARVNLHAILPVLEDLERLDREYGGKGAGKYQGKILVKVAKKPELAVTIQFKGPGIKVFREKWGRPSLILEFASPDALNDSFSGGKSKPRIRKLLFGIPLLLKFVKLSKLMGASLMGDGAPGGIKTRAAILLRVVVHAMEVLARHHPEVQPTVAGIEGTIQFGIEPDGPFYHITFQNGKVAVYDTEHSSPKSTISFVDTETAVAVLTGALDAMDAMGQQKMKMEGDPGFALQIGGIMGKVGEILQPPK